MVLTVPLCTWGFGVRAVDLPQVCFSGSVLLETFDIEVVSYDGHSPATGNTLKSPEVCWVWV